MDRKPLQGKWFCVVGEYHAKTFAFEHTTRNPNQLRFECPHFQRHQTTPNLQFLETYSNCTLKGRLVVRLVSSLFQIEGTLVVLGQGNLQFIVKDCLTASNHRTRSNLLPRSSIQDLLTISYIQSSSVSQSWVSHETAATSGPQQVQNAHTTERRGTSTTAIRTHDVNIILTFSLPQSVREGSSASQHPYRKQAHPSRPHPRRQHQISRPAPGFRQFFMGLRGHRP